MKYNILAIGDVVGDNGIAHIAKSLPALKQQKGIDFTVANGENASGIGLTAVQAQAILDAGVDVITLGNHTLSKKEIIPFLEESDRILRPANYANPTPGRGHGVFQCGDAKLRIINLIGKCEGEFTDENPFFAADRLLGEQAEEADFTVMDFHSGDNGERLTMGYYLDGRIAAVWGTHSHTPTADEQILEKGTGFVTDLGMTGPVRSVQGITPEDNLAACTGGRCYYRIPEGPCKMQGVIFTLDSETGLCTAVERVDIR
ncbi:MAG: YmdB family metallophosphoesterase [Clostridia bacterium]|nr:YmdB family metallophosphoesterase [Clostridia bacterium]